MTPEDVTNDTVTSWFQEQMPDDWFEALEARCDKDEIVVRGTIQPPEQSGDSSSAQNPELAELECATVFREASRDGRVQVALRAEALFERKVSWVVSCGSTEKAYTTLALPVMTRLGYEERQVLDTLVAGGVARSRSEAVNWCVQLVGRDQADWLDKLRAAVGGIDDVRSQGPS